MISQASKQQRGIHVAFAFLLLVLLSCDRGSVNRIASGDSSRSANCYVWAFTNLETGKVRFSAHALDTGWVPALGETNFSSIPELASAIRKRRFGLITKVKSGYLGDPNDQTNLSGRPWIPGEVAALRERGISITLAT